MGLTHCPHLPCFLQVKKIQTFFPGVVPLILEVHPPWQSVIMTLFSKSMKVSRSLILSWIIRIIFMLNKVQHLRQVCICFYKYMLFSLLFKCSVSVCTIPNNMSITCFSHQKLGLKRYRKNGRFLRKTCLVCLANWPFY